VATVCPVDEVVGGVAVVVVVVVVDLVVYSSGSK
jgi:hypothetical protein